MARAGLAAANYAREIANTGQRVLVLAGPGNNGGDALVLARHLKEWWFSVSVLFTGDRSRLPADSRAAFESWLSSGGGFIDTLPHAAECGLIVDGLFGIGLQRPLSGR